MIWNYCGTFIVEFCYCRTGHWSFTSNSWYLKSVEQWVQLLHSTISWRYLIWNGLCFLILLRWLIPVTFYVSASHVWMALGHLPLIPGT
jgi:hypothetical protein